MTDWSHLDDCMKDDSDDDGAIRFDAPNPRRKPVSRKPAAKPGTTQNLASTLLSLAMLGGCTMCVMRMPKQTDSQFAAQDNRILAIHCAQSHVKTMLRSPSSAKWPGLFSGFENHAKKNGDGTYTVHSWVDADNAFGASIRTWYVCQLRLHKSGHADIIEAALIE